MANMDRADDMIRDILDASKIKAGEKFLFDLQSCNIQLIAQQVVEDFTSIYGSRFNLEAMGDMNGVWDESLIQRMMENLVNNAIKYGHSASPIGIRIHHYQEKVEISVHNFGNPISEENQKRMFQPYTRVEANPASQKGWGIGLTLVKGFAEGMGGTVDVESSVEKGTTFTISLPFHVIE